jgi:hypothetical protein
MFKRLTIIKGKCSISLTSWRCAATEIHHGSWGRFPGKQANRPERIATNEGRNTRDCPLVEWSNGNDNRFFVCYARACTCKGALWTIWQPYDLLYLTGIRAKHCRSPTRRGGGSGSFSAVCLTLHVNQQDCKDSVTMSSIKQRVVHNPRQLV